MAEATKDQTTWYFVDESGDPTFFNRRGQVIVGRQGCSPILLLGFVEMEDPRSARLALAKLRKALVADPYLRSIPSMRKTARVFHAKDDCPEVRKAVYELIMRLDFRFQCVVARKDLYTFLHGFHGRSDWFYDSLVSDLFGAVIHRSAKNRIYFAKRGGKTRQAPLEKAIRRGAEVFQSVQEILNLTNRFHSPGTPTVPVEVSVQCQTPSDEPCLQIADYMNWTVQRAFVRREMRYFDFIRDKVEVVFDLYDYHKRPDNRYDRTKNPFDAKKISPL